MQQAWQRRQHVCSTAADSQGKTVSAEQPEMRRLPVNCTAARQGGRAAMHMALVPLLHAGATHSHACALS